MMGVVKPESLERPPPPPLFFFFFFFFFSPPPPFDDRSPFACIPDDGRSCSPVSPSPPPPPTARAWRAPRGALATAGSRSACRATPSDVGYQHGTLLASEIADAVAVAELNLTHDGKRDWGFFR